jgi:hypothetical protein
MPRENDDACGNAVGWAKAPLGAVPTRMLPQIQTWARFALPTLPARSNYLTAGNVFASH